MKAITLSGITALVILSLTMSSVYAENDTQYIPLGSITSIEVTTIPLIIPENNSLPWGYVEGKINNPSSDYPVIIQFFQGGIPVHFAQVIVNEDDTYQYKFRVLDSNNGVNVNILDGAYKVKIFKVVYTIPENSAYK